MFVIPLLNLPGHPSTESAAGDEPATACPLGFNGGLHDEHRWCRIVEVVDTMTVPSDREGSHQPGFWLDHRRASHHQRCDNEHDHHED